MLIIADKYKCKPNVDDLKQIKARFRDGKIRQYMEDILTLYTPLDSQNIIFPHTFACITQSLSMSLR